MNYGLPNCKFLGQCVFSLKILNILSTVFCHQLFLMRILFPPLTFCRLYGIFSLGVEFLFILTVFQFHYAISGLPWWLSGEESACNPGDPGSILGSGRSPGEGNGNPLQYSCLENPMDRGAWWGCSLWGCKDSDKTEHARIHAIPSYRFVFISFVFICYFSLF